MGTSQTSAFLSRGFQNAFKLTPHHKAYNVLWYSLAFLLLVTFSRFLLQLGHIYTLIYIRICVGVCMCVCVWICVYVCVYTNYFCTPIAVSSPSSPPLFSASAHPLIVRFYSETADFPWISTKHLAYQVAVRLGTSSVEAG